MIHYIACQLLAPITSRLAGRGGGDVQGNDAKQNDDGLDQVEEVSDAQRKA